MWFPRTSHNNLLCSYQARKVHTKNWFIVCTIKKGYECSQKDTHTCIIFTKSPQVEADYGPGSPICNGRLGPFSVAFLKGSSATLQAGVLPY